MDAMSMNRRREWPGFGTPWRTASSGHGWAVSSRLIDDFTWPHGISGLHSHLGTIVNQVVGLGMRVRFQAWPTWWPAWHRRRAIGQKPHHAR